MLLFSGLDFELSLLLGVLKFNVREGVVRSEQLVISGRLPAKV